MKRLSEAPNVHPSVQARNTTYGTYVEVPELCVLENVHIGDYSYCGPGTIMQNVHVGKFANIAALTRLGPTAHPMERASLHHFTYRSAMYGMGPNDDAFFAEREARMCWIGHDTWIGHGAVVMPEVTVGTGAVVAAGAIVTKDVPPYTIVAGVPARVVRERFTWTVQEALMRIAWWEWPHERLADAMDDFRGPIETFIAKHDPQETK